MSDSYPYKTGNIHGISSALDEKTQEDWKCTYLRYNDWIYRDFESELQACIQSLSERLQLIENGLIPLGSQHYYDFINIYLPQIVKSMLGKNLMRGRYGKIRIHSLYFCFILHVLSRRMPHMWRNMPGDVQILLTVLDHNQHFYDSKLDEYDTGRMNEIYKESEIYRIIQVNKEQHYYEYSKKILSIDEKLYVNMCYYHFVKFLNLHYTLIISLKQMLNPQPIEMSEKEQPNVVVVEGDGDNNSQQDNHPLGLPEQALVCIRQYKNTQPNRLNFEQVIKIIELAYHLRHAYTSNQYKKLCQILFEGSASFLLSLKPEEFKSATKQHFVTFLFNLNEIGLDLEVTSEFNKYEIKQNLELFIAYKCLIAEQLQKRVYGLQEIEEKIIGVLERQDRISLFEKSNEQRRIQGVQELKQGPYLTYSCTKYLNVELMLDFFKQRGILNILMGQNMHPQLLQRCSKIFKFLYKYEILGRNQLELIWQTIVSKHEAVKSALVSTLRSLVKELKRDELNFLLGKMKSLSYAEYDKEFFSTLEMIIKSLLIYRNMNGILIPGFFHLKKRNNNKKVVRKLSLNDQTINSNNTENQVRKRKLLVEEEFEVNRDEQSKTADLEKLSPLHSGKKNKVRMARGGSADAPSKRKTTVDSPPDPMGRLKDRDLMLKKPISHFTDFKKSDIKKTEFKPPFQLARQVDNNQENTKKGAQDKQKSEVSIKKDQEDNLNQEQTGEQAPLSTEDMLSLLDLLWNMMLDSAIENGLPKQVSEASFVVLGDILCALEDQSFETYILRIIKHIRKNNSAITCIKLLKRLIIPGMGMKPMLDQAKQQQQQQQQSSQEEANEIHETPQDAVLGQMKSTNPQIIVPSQQPIKLSKRVLFIRKICEMYNFIDVYIHSIIDFKMCSLQKATQGLVVLNNGEDGAVEEQDQVKTQASLQGNRREDGGPDDDQDVADQEIKENDAHSPLHQNSNTEEESLISSLSSPLTMTPSSPSYKKQDDDLLANKNPPVQPPTIMLESTAPTSTTPLQRPEIQEQNVNNILDTQQEQDNYQRGTADEEEEDDEIQPESSRSTDVSLPTDIGQDQQNSLNNGNSFNQIQSNMFQNLITNEQQNLKYFDELKKRISFLIFLFANGDIKISQNHIQMLWDSLVVFGFSEFEKNQFFSMFAQLLQGAPTTATGIRGIVSLPPAFSQQTIDMLYYDTLLRLKFKEVTPAIYACFQRFFLFVNSQFGAVLILSQGGMASGSAVSAVRQQQQVLSIESNRDQIEVFNIKLVGIEALWEIVLQAKDKTVAKLSAQFLRKLYRRLANSVIENSLVEIKNCFVDTVMAQIATGVQRMKCAQEEEDAKEGSSNQANEEQPNNEENETKGSKERSSPNVAAGQELIHHLEVQKRCTVGDAKQRISKVIEIIMDFLYEFEGLGQKRSHSSKNRGWNKDSDVDESKSLITVKVKITTTAIQTIKGGQFLQFIISQNCKLRQLKQRLLQNLRDSISPDELQIFFSGKDLNLKPENMSLKACGLQNNSNLLISKAEFLEYATPVYLDLGQDQSTQIGGGHQKTVTFALTQDQMKMVLEISGGRFTEQFIKYLAKKKEKAFDDLVSYMFDLQDSQADQLVAQMNAQKQEQMAKKMQEVANEQQAAAQNSEDIIQTKMSLMIANRDQNFNMVFELLNLNVPQISVPVWKLINLIPVNKLKLEQMKQLQYEENPDWDQVLDSKSMFKLLYALQIINGFILPGDVTQKKVKSENIQQDNTKQEDEKSIDQEPKSGQAKQSPEAIDLVTQRDNWRYKFLQNGGCDHLYKILMNFEYKQIQEGSFEIQCVSQLLNIIKIFFQAALLSDAKDNDLLRNFLLQRRTITNFGPSSSFLLRKNSNSSFASSFTAGGRSFGAGVQATPSLGGGEQQQHLELPTSTQQQPSGNQIVNAIKSIGPKIDHPISTPPPQANRSGSGPSSVAGGISNQPPKIDQMITIVEQLSKSDQINLILKIMNLEHLIFKLLTFLCKEGSQQNNNQQDKVEGPKKSSMDDLIVNAIDLVLPCILYDPLLLKHFYQFEYKNQNIEKIIVRMLAAFPSERVRKKLEQMIRIIAVNINEDSFYYEKQDDIIADTIAPNTNVQEMKQQIPETHKIPQCQKQNSNKSPLQSPRVFFLNILLKNLPSQDNESGFCDEYFTVLTALLRLCTPTQLEQIVSLSELFHTCLGRLKKRKIYETNNIQDPPDKILIGFLTILTVILQIRQDFKSQQAGVFKPSELINLLFDYLFQLPNQEDSQISLPKIKTSQTRRKCFILLNQLCRNENQNFKELLFRMTKEQLNEFIQNDVQETKNDNQWSQQQGKNDNNLDNNKNNKSKSLYIKQEYLDWDIPIRSSASNYVGLRNFGCTCYINSLLQQLYMIPNIRWGFLKEKVPETNHPQAQNYLLLIAMQEIFANLQLSAMQFYQPSRFMQVFKMYGEAINVRQQQDADEFFSLLGDQLEGQSKNIKTLLRNEIGSTLIHQIKSLEKQFPYTSKREAEQIRISLEIKNKKSIHEALDFFVKGDILQGQNKYMCDEHNKKIRAVKRCYLGQLSKTLVIHLKRFEFDMTTMMRYKVNDYCEFPTVLDLRPWTEQGIREKQMKQEAAAKQEEKKEEVEQEEQQPSSNSNDYIYNLVGVLIHSGSSEAGHYYSYIKDRESEDGGWFEFNDTQVRPFDLANLKKSWFGGELQEGDLGYGSMYAEIFGIGKEGKAMRSNNAYLLFYEKANKEKDCEVGEQQEVASKLEGVKEQNKQEEKAEQNIVENDVFLQDLLQTQVQEGQKINKESEQQQNKLSGPQPTLIRGVPQPLYNIIMSQNNLFLKMRQIGDPDYIHFLRQFLNLGEEQSEQSHSIDVDDSCSYELLQLKKYSQQYKMIIVQFCTKYYDPVSYAYQVIDKPENYELETEQQYKKLGFCESFQQINLEIQDDKVKEQPDYSEIFKENLYYNERTEYGSALHYSKQQIMEKIKHVQKRELRPSDQQLRKRIDSEAALYTLKLGTIFAYKVLAQQRDTSQFVNLMTSFRSQFQFHAKASVWILTHFEQNLMNLAGLMFSNNEDIRQSFLSLLCTVSRKAFHAEENIFYTVFNHPTIVFYETDHYNRMQYVKPYLGNSKDWNSAFQRFLHRGVLTVMMPNSKGQKKTYTEFFKYLSFIGSQIHYRVSHYLIKRGDLIYVLISMIISTQMMGDSFEVPNYAPPLQALATLIKCTSTNGIQQINQFAPGSIYQDGQDLLNLSLSEQSLKLLLDQYNFRRLICTYGSQSNQASNAVTEIINYICWGDIAVSQKVIQYFMTYLMDNKRNPQKLQLIFKLMIEVFSIKDGLQIDRLDSFFNSQKHGIDFDVLNKLREMRYLFNGFTILCLVFILDIFTISSNTKQYMENIGIFQKMKWIVDFLQGTDRSLSPWGSVQQDLAGYGGKQTAKAMAEDILSAYKTVVGQERYEQIRKEGYSYHAMDIHSINNIGSHIKPQNLPPQAHQGQQEPQIIDQNEQEQALNQFRDDYRDQLQVSEQNLADLGIDQKNNTSLQVNTGTGDFLDNESDEYTVPALNMVRNQSEELRNLMSDNDNNSHNNLSQFEQKKEEFQQQNNDVDDGISHQD